MGTLYLWQPQDFQPMRAEEHPGVHMRTQKWPRTQWKAKMKRAHGMVQGAIWGRQRVPLACTACCRDNSAGGGEEGDRSHGHATQLPTYDIRCRLYQPRPAPVYDGDDAPSHRTRTGRGRQTSLRQCRCACTGSKTSLTGIKVLGSRPLPSHVTGVGRPVAPWMPPITSCKWAKSAIVTNSMVKFQEIKILTPGQIPWGDDASLTQRFSGSPNAVVLRLQIA